MPTPKPTRWANPNLPQLLQIATFLLYFTAASAVLARLVRFGSPTPYYVLGARIFGVEITPRGEIVSGGAIIFEVAAIAGLVYSGAMIASSRKLGWQLGVGLAVGLVAIPLLLLGFDLFRSDYIISWMFDVALLALLLHPTSREYQKIWFD